VSGLLREIIARHGGIDGNAEDMATTLVDDLKLNARQREALYPLILAFCANIDRAGVRSCEPAIDTISVPRRNGRPVEKVGHLAVMSERFSLGKGRWVRWGEATVADHRERIEYLTRHRDGVDTTIGRHAHAIAVIEATPGATCLDDITTTSEGETAA